MNRIAEIDAHVTALTRRVAAEKAERAADYGFLEGWSGQGEVGGSISTGNTVSEAFAAEIDTPLIPLGAHALHGIAAPCAVFTVAEN